MNTLIIYVLIVVFDGGANRVATVTAEFNSYEACEIARKGVEKAHRGPVSITSQGCYKK